MLYPQPPKGGALKTNKLKHQIFFTPFRDGVNEENQQEGNYKGRGKKW